MPRNVSIKQVYVKAIADIYGTAFIETEGGGDRFIIIIIIIIITSEPRAGA